MTNRGSEWCRRCKGPNVVWCAPSPLWNAVMRDGSIDGPIEFGDLVCPTCFVILAEERGIAFDWVVDARTVNVELETVTPSGRTWDAERMLWQPAHVEARRADKDFQDRLSDILREDQEILERLAR